MRWGVKKKAIYSSPLSQTVSCPADHQQVQNEQPGRQKASHKDHLLTGFIVEFCLLSLCEVPQPMHLSLSLAVLTCNFRSMTRCSRYLTRASGYFLRQVRISSGLKLFCSSSKGLLVKTWTPTWKKNSDWVMLCEVTPLPLFWVLQIHALGKITVGNRVTQKGSAAQGWQRPRGDSQ